MANTKEEVEVVKKNEAQKESKPETIEELGRITETFEESEAAEKLQVTVRADKIETFGKNKQQR